MKKPEFKSPEWNKLLFEAMLADFGEAYKACRECNHPTPVSYNCRNCGCVNP